MNQPPKAGTDFKRCSLNRFNMDAWEQLYAASGESVWGEEPIGFLPAWLDRMRANGGPGCRVLEAGAGDGRNLPALASLGGALYACDGSASALERAGRRLGGQVVLKQCELGNLPFADGFFDLVCLFDVFETLPEVGRAVAELYRVTATGGLAVANVPDFSDGIAGHDMTPLESGGFLFRNRYFFRFYEEHEAEEILRAAGFHVLHSELCTWEEPAHPGFRSESHRHTSRVFALAKR